MWERDQGSLEGSEATTRVGIPTMSRQDGPSEGWFYKRAGETCGPVSAERLQELLTGGLLQPRQAVWQKGSHGLLFVHAATAASGAARGGSWPSPPPASA
jgi:GYF domain 2